MNTAIFKSTRFWSIVIVAVIWFLEGNGWMATNAVAAITTILLGHVGVRTFDRLGEKIGQK